MAYLRKMINKNISSEDKKLLSKAIKKAGSLTNLAYYLTENHLYHHQYYVSHIIYWKSKALKLPIEVKIILQELLKGNKNEN